MKKKTVQRIAKNLLLVVATLWGICDKGEE